MAIPNQNAGRSWKFHVPPLPSCLGSRGGSFGSLNLYTLLEPAPGLFAEILANVEAAGERHAVRILDLSAGGAKLDCPVALSSGTAVILDCGTLGRPAVVRWQTAGALGICFDSELDPRDLSDLAERSKALTAWRKTRG